LKHFDHITLLTRKFDSTLSQNEQAQLSEWLASSDANRAEADILDKIWQDSTAYEPTVEFDSSAAFQKFKSNSLSSEPSQLVKTTAAGSSTSILSYLIGAILFLGAGYLIYNATSGASANLDENGVKNVVLEEGAKVWLDDNSIIDQASDDTYQVEGKAFIDASTNGENVSIDLDGQKINTNNAKYTVNTAQNDLVQIDVESGTVTVETATGKKINVPAGQRFELANNGTYKQSKLQTNNSFSWKAKTLEFNNTPMSIVFQDLESYYGIDIQASNVNIADCYFTSPILTNTNLDVVLDILKESHQTEFSTVGEDTYRLANIDCK